MSSYEPLHHKYRPQTFADLVGQEAIATTLTNAIAAKRIAPAYLFTGPRGTGKTSSARILAKSLNCLAFSDPTATPCGKCEVCRAITRGSALDVIEIDAASNTGVDNIREIIERAQFAPVQCRYKVYVIDECHMLSVAAFNALLKTLEEPPDRVIFVLATTDPQRVLPTIISRCQRFDYRRIPLAAMVSHLGKIAQQETIDIAQDALILVAQIANGGLRDAESLLDQLSLLSGTITTDKVWELVGAVPEQDLLLLLQAIASNNAELVIDRCRHLMNRGREPLVVLQNLAGFYLNLLIAKTAPNRPDMVAVTAPTWQALCNEAHQWNLETILQGQQRLKDSEFQLKNTTQPRLWLEVTLLSLLPSAFMKSEVTSQKSEVIPTPTPPLTPSPPPSPSPHPSPPPLTPSPPLSQNPVINDVNGIWPAILAKLQPFSQGLVNSHCYFLNLEESAAYIGVRSQGLLKLVQGKIPDLEAAFAAVCQRPIKVHLKVASPSSNAVSTSPQPVNPSPSPVPISNSETEKPVIAQPVINSDKETISNTPKTEIKAFSHKQNNLPESEINLKDISENLDDEDLKKVAENFAKIFEGEIVDLAPSFNSKIPSLSVGSEEQKIKHKTQPNSQLSDSIKLDINNSIRVKGRPEIIEDEDDLDF
ncbi:DNA polymerase III, subunits gamma and tau [Rippkaea orientalis PCC 8801]|uniref:DNA polymerase III subunit gamma/tau n=1 Tax=Rippkaea orientalis (strain PCC 8801 / RF-1) TaxID=41431 RepID=B7JZ29_RIPO1|nr:DNA polymerase III subunit gamma/tau [Rippkaea orientalis]ACK66106.1 DNA polymerase III, subunits gamma and tau [Rippkaea orientalis PCC 8801]